MPNKSFAYLLNVEPSNLAFLTMCDTEFDKIIRRCTDQNGTPLEIGGKLYLASLIDK